MGVKCNNRQIAAHRLSWMFYHKGEVPDGMVVMHTCDNPPCVNPAHLQLGTQPENIADRDAKKRQAKGAKMGNATITQGQAFAIGNLVKTDLYAWHQIASMVGCTRTQVVGIATGRTWPWLTGIKRERAH